MSSAVEVAVRERPILFKGRLVRAILAGQKTQTRRVMKPQPYPNGIKVATGVEPDNIDGTPYPKGEIVCHCDYYPPSATLWKGGMLGADAGELECCPYGVPGERLWVREAFRVDACVTSETIYRADHEGTFSAEELTALPWRPSIHMERLRSRLTLEVLDVRVERLQEISEEDAKAEGATTDPRPGTVNGEPATLYPMTHRQAFVWTWDSINGKRAPWASNPWVWAITFRRVA